MTTVELSSTTTQPVTTVKLSSDAKLVACCVASEDDMEVYAAEDAYNDFKDLLRMLKFFGRYAKKNKTYLILSTNGVEKKKELLELLSDFNKKTKGNTFCLRAECDCVENWRENHQYECSIASNNWGYCHCTCPYSCNGECDEVTFIIKFHWPLFSLRYAAQKTKKFDIRSIESGYRATFRQP